MADETNIITVPIPKGKGMVQLDLAKLNDDVFRELVLQGAKVLLTRGMSKITKAELGDEDKVKAEAMLKAEANVTDLYEGKVRMTGGAKASKVSGAVKTEAMRLARNIIKDEIKRAGGKISHVKPSVITQAAKEYL